MVTMLAVGSRAVTDGLADLAYLDLGGRLAKYLLNESQRQGRPTITLTLTQSELGQMLGRARQTVNQVMHTLEEEGLIGARWPDGADHRRAWASPAVGVVRRSVRMNFRKCQTADSTARRDRAYSTQQHGGCGAHTDTGAKP